ncbi:MAG: hypothetical protein JSV91_13755 [Phycisphaerales bacterium]|nr:MAG: hypothetical protein JSV91_13755 [Phycisphaerales bacterium]
MAGDRSVVLVGHCRPDTRRLEAAVTRALPDAPVHAVNDDASLEPHLSRNPVLLINRVLYGKFANDSGIELIRRICGGEAPPPCLLISNFEDARAEAVEAGAKAGFGKRQLHEEETARILREAATS